MFPLTDEIFISFGGWEDKSILQAKLLIVDSRGNNLEEIEIEDQTFSSNELFQIVFGLTPLFDGIIYKSNLNYYELYWPLLKSPHTGLSEKQLTQLERVFLQFLEEVMAQYYDWAAVLKQLISDKDISLLEAIDKNDLTPIWSLEGYWYSGGGSIFSLYNIFNTFKEAIKSITGQELNINYDGASDFPNKHLIMQSIVIDITYKAIDAVPEEQQKTYQYYDPEPENFITPIPNPPVTPINNNPDLVYYRCTCKGKTNVMKADSPATANVEFISKYVDVYYVFTQGTPSRQHKRIPRNDIENKEHWYDMDIDIRFINPDVVPVSEGLIFLGWKDISGSPIKTGQNISVGTSSQFTVYADFGNYSEIIYIAKNGTPARQTKTIVGNQIYFEFPEITPRLNGTPFTVKRWLDEEGNEVNESTQITSSQFTVYADFGIEIDYLQNKVEESAKEEKEPTLNAIQFPEMLSQGGNTNLIYGKEATYQNLKTLLLSTKKTLLGDPFFGVNLRNMLYEKNNIIIRDLVVDDILTNINIFLPQLRLTRRDIDVESKNNSIVVNIKARNIIDYSLENYTLELLSGEEI